MSNFQKIVTFVLFIFLCGLSALFVLHFQLDEKTKRSSEIALNFESDKSSFVELENSDSQIEDLNAQLEILSSSSSSLLDRIERLENKYSTASGIQKQISPLFQKQIIYIGSADTKENNWTNSGVEVNLNSSDYPSDVEAIFEVGLSVIGGEAWARLVNKTTGSIMTITEISHSSSTTTWKSSPTFKLFNGNNTYALQVRSTSGEVANFSGARIVLDKH